MRARLALRVVRTEEMLGGGAAGKEGSVTGVFLAECPVGEKKRVKRREERVRDEKTEREDRKEEGRDTNIQGSQKEKSNDRK